MAATRPNQADQPALDDARIDWERTPLLHALGTVAAGVRSTSYAHEPSIDPARGEYHFDCSTLVGWLLYYAAPQAHQALTAGLSGRPLARDFYRRFVTSPTDRTAQGWLRVLRLTDAQPGDILAWRRPDRVRSRSTGHVAVLVLPPVRVVGYVDAFLVRIADASSTPHDRDWREVGSGQGFGLGTLLLLIDPQGEPIGYGWRGMRSPDVYLTDIEIGRPLR